MGKKTSIVETVVSSGWRDEAMFARKHKEKTDVAMNQFADLVEGWVEGKVELPLLLLAFHQVAMDHGSYARKKTMKVALKSSIEEVSKVAPSIFPPDRVPSRVTKIKRSQANG